MNSDAQPRDFFLPGDHQPDPSLPGRHAPDLRTWRKPRNTLASFHARRNSPAMKLQKGFWFLCFVTTSFMAAVAGAAEASAPLQLRDALPLGQTNAYNLPITQQGA